MLHDGNRLQKLNPATISSMVSTAELAAIADRFRPNEDLDRHLDVLDNLINSMPASVANVLKSIRAELVRRA